MRISLLQIPIMRRNFSLGQNQMIVSLSQRLACENWENMELKLNNQYLLTRLIFAMKLWNPIIQDIYSILDVKARIKTLDVQTCSIASKQASCTHTGLWWVFSTHFKKLFQPIIRNNFNLRGCKTIQGKNIKDYPFLTPTPLPSAVFFTTTRLQIWPIFDPYPLKKCQR